LLTDAIHASFIVFYGEMILKRNTMHVVISYETEQAARARLICYGYPAELANEIAVYLGQATDLPYFFEEITKALYAQGMTVDFIELDELLTRVPELVLQRESTILWSITDGIRFYRGSSVSALSRIIGCARYGSPAAVQHICQNKFSSLTLAAAAGIPIAPTKLIEGSKQLASLGDWQQHQGPYFVKPNTLGAKIGIFSDSRCATLEEALDRAERLWARYQDRALIQPFVAGDDVRISFMNLGKDFRAQLGIEQLAKDPLSETGGEFMTMKDNETLSGARDTAGTKGGFGGNREAAFVPKLINLRQDLTSRSIAAVGHIETLAEKLADLFELRDYFSIDVRIDGAGKPIMFEFEICPGITIYDFQNYLKTTHGLSLGSALAQSLKIAFQNRWDKQEA
jgi:D-alanine-D-alanine ligase